jgi:hypothetical protein
VVSVESVVAAGRRFSERMMTSACEITRETTVPGTLDPETLLQVETFETVWAGPCRVKSVSTVTSARETEGQLDTVQQLELYVPVDGTGQIGADDTVTITAGGYDPTLTGKQFRIAGTFNQSYATARRLPIEGLT